MSTSTLSQGPGLTVPGLLALPNPATPVVDPTSTRAIWPCSTFIVGRSNDESRTENAFYIVDIRQTFEGQSVEDWDKTKEPKKLIGGLTNLEVAWLDERTILFLRPVRTDAKLAPGEKRIDHPAEVSDTALGKLQEEWKAKDDGAGTEVWALDVESQEEYQLGQLPVAISNIKTKQVSTKESILAFSASVFPDGSIFTVAKQESKIDSRQAGSDIKVYDSLPVRSWDHWCPTDGQKKQVHIVRLSKDSSEANAGGNEWKMEMEDGQVGKSGETVSRPKVVSPLAGTNLECPVGAFGSASDFTLSSTHLVFHSKDPQLPPAWHTRTNVYIVSLSPRSDEDSKPRMVSIGTQGASSSPAFNEDGTKLAWLEMREDGYEADRNRVVVYDVEKDTRRGLTESWDRSPGKIEWSKDGEAVFLITEERGHVKLFALDVDKDGEEPRALTDRHSVSSATPLSNGNVLVSINSFTHPNELSILSNISEADNKKDDSKPTLISLSSFTRTSLSSKSLHPGEEFTFAGSEGKEVHGWIMFPPSHSSSSSSSSKSDKTESPASYPLAFLCHGGPQSSFHDSWCTRWNLNSYAGKGYITVAINRTGSTGFGQEFCDAIKEDWAGAPYRDLVAGLKYVQKIYPEIDSNRMASLGGSYAGFMQNWFQGHNDELGFKTLVCFQGIFSITQAYYSTEELYFFEREFGGTPWQVPENYDKFNPRNFISKWKTPQLTIHTSKDYRLPDSEGLGVFNTLQRLGIPSRLIIFPSENHWDLTPQNNVRWHEEVFKWIGEWTKTTDAC